MSWNNIIVALQSYTVYQEPRRKSTRTRRKTERAQVRPISIMRPHRYLDRVLIVIAQNMVLDSDDDGAMEIDSDEAFEADDSGDEVEDTRHPSLLHPRDLENFLKLCSALSNFLEAELDEERLTQADRLLRDYCTELLQVCTRCSHGIVVRI